MEPDLNIVLIGFMGAGKSTVGGILARRLSRPLLDTDAEIEREVGLTIPEIFKLHGEPHFRKLEREIVRKIEGRRGLVIAAGGGMPVDPGNLKRLRRNGTVIYLKAEFDRLIQRVGAGEARPLIESAGGPEELARLLKEREQAYLKADHIVETSGITAQEAADRVLALVTRTG